MQKITQIQHYLQFSLKISNEFNIKSGQAYLIGLSFPFASEERLNKLGKETDTAYEKIQKCSKDVTIFSSNLKHIFGMDNVEIWLSLFLKKL